LRLKWTQRALRQLLDAQEHIARENPTAAKQVVERIATAASRLLHYPMMGRVGRISGTHELVVNRTPYFIVYVLMGDTVQIVRVLHGKQSWPPQR
jgi:toxin ParE1/3/4